MHLFLELVVHQDISCHPGVA